MNKAEELRQKAEEFLKEKFIKMDFKVKSDIPGISKDYFLLSDLLEQYAQQEYNRGFQNGMDEGYKAQRKNFNHQNQSNE